MDGKLVHVKTRALSARGLRWLLPLIGGCLLAQPSTAEAQLGWPTSWNPWKKEVPSGQTPTDPFSARRATPGPEYRMAAQTSAAPNYPPSTATAGGPMAGAYGGQAAMPGAATGAPYGYQATYPTTSADHALGGNPYQYPQTGSPTAGYPATSAYAPQAASPAASGYSTPTGSPNYGEYKMASLPVNRATGADIVGQAPATTEGGKSGLFEPARIVAIVNGEPILAGDLLGPINQMLEERLASVPAAQRDSISPEEIEQFQEQAMKQMLPGLIDIKVVYLDFMRTVPADRRNEMEEVLNKNYEMYQLDEDLKNAGVNTRAELDLKLRESGGSFAKKQRQFVERLVAQQQIQKNVKLDEEVTHQQMLDHYNEQAEKYRKPARAKWEQLMVRFSRVGDRQAAWQAIAAMGDQVLRGAPLDAVARRESHGIRASEGGQYDWTSKGSLKNETIDRAIFSLPIGELSPIIESPEGFHIVRVIDREAAGMVPFTEAQVEIKEQIQKQRRQEKMEAYLKEIKSKAQVWTIFDEAG